MNSAPMDYCRHLRNHKLQAILLSLSKCHVDMHKQLALLPGVAGSPYMAADNSLAPHIFHPMNVDLQSSHKVVSKCIISASGSIQSSDSVMFDMLELEGLKQTRVDLASPAYC